MLCAILDTYAESVPKPLGEIMNKNSYLSQLDNNQAFAWANEFCQLNNERTIKSLREANEMVVFIWANYNESSRDMFNAYVSKIRGY